MKIQDWNPEERPREKMMSQGADALTNAELLAILINTGQKGKTAVDIAQEVLHDCHNSLVELGHILLRGEGRDRLSGLGDAKICAINAALELGRRRQHQEEIEREQAIVVKNSAQLFAVFNQPLSDLDHEELWALYMSKNGKIIQKLQISEGGVDFAGADVRKIIRPAIEYMASVIAICHNHPHSSTKPSKPDQEFTYRLKQALSYFDIRLLDHIVISEGKYYSFVENGLL